MEEEMDTTNAIDEEEERKLLADTSGNEEDDDEDSGADEDDDDDDDDDAVNEQNETEIRRIKEILSTNPYEYEAHKLLIEKLQKMGDLERLRAAREDMSSKFPLTPQIWLSWLKDEMKLALTQEEKNSVTELCERAVNDYLSVDVWFEYLQFCTGLGTEKETIEKIRNLFERALTAVGLHVMKGDLIWETYREFENFIVNMMETSNDLEQKNQINRIGKLFRRQLACPLFGIEKTFEEYELWKSAEGASCKEDENTIKIGYERALGQLNERLPFEEKLESAQNQSEQFDIYKAYLIKEKQIGDPARVTVLYERAITDVCLESTLWLDYLDYLENHLKINDIAEKAYARAVRNVPWCGKIWQNWMRFYEKINKPLSDLQKLIENALAVGFSTSEEYKNLWLTYLEYLRRKLDDRSVDEKKQLEILRKNFNKACEHLETFEGDPTCEIKQYWARTEAIHGNNMEETRRLWAEIMSRKCHSESAASWLEYISIERCYGDTKKLRKLFQRALTNVQDFPEIITNAWINFERDEGTLEQMEICEKRTRELLEKVAEERKKSQINSIQEAPVSRRAGKRKMEDDGRWKNLEPPSEKKPLLKQSALNLEKNKKPVETGVDLKKSKIAPPPGYQEAHNIEKMEEESHEIHKVDEKVTVFVSNLDYTASEDEIREVLKPVEPITLIRLVKDYKNRSKGFGYVQLSSPAAVEEALKLDRIRVNGRPMFISRCDPNKTSKGPNFKYKTELERNKLFVKGLNPSTTKEKLEEIFKVYGNLKDIRIVTYRNGHSKGLAYIEFEDEESASKALVKTDKMNIDEKEISVEISKPPQRKQVDETHEIKSLGGFSTSRSNFGNPKTVLSMVPRTVKRNTASSSQVSDNGAPQPLSNQDFRNMLLKK